MISLEPEEVEIMCKEAYHYFQAAEEALRSDHISTKDEASALVASLGEIRECLREVLLQEGEKGGSQGITRKIELLAGMCATLEEQAIELRGCLGMEGRSCAA